MGATDSDSESTSTTIFEPGECAPFDPPTTGADTEANPGPEDAHLYQCFGEGNGEFRTKACVTQTCAAPLEQDPIPLEPPLVFPGGQEYGPGIVIGACCGTLDLANPGALQEAEDTCRADCIAKGCLVAHDQLVLASENPPTAYVGEQLAWFASQLETAEGFAGCVAQVQEDNVWEPLEHPTPDQFAKLKESAVEVNCQLDAEQVPFAPDDPAQWVECGENPNFFVGNAAPATAMIGALFGGSVVVSSGSQQDTATVKGSTFALRVSTCEGEVCPFTLDGLDLLTEDLELGVIKLVKPIAGLRRPAVGMLQGTQVLFAAESLRLRAEFGVTVLGLPLLGDGRFTVTGTNTEVASATLAGELFSLDVATFQLGLVKATISTTPSPCQAIDP